MKVKCDYCGSFINDTDEVCPNCGGVNSHLMRSADGIPKTIEELKKFCQDKNLPLEKMRFYIGVDFKEPKAFGIFKDDDGNFVVYKNKGDGTRAERYRGKDEAYAVNEIYQKMKSEVQIRREKYGGSGSGGGSPHGKGPKKRRSRISSKLIDIGISVGIFAVIAVCVIIFLRHNPETGYYYYNGNYYYCQNSHDWYRYDDDGDFWFYESEIDSELSGNYSSYFEGRNYESDYDATNFADTEFYDDSSSSYNDDWDGNDWDFGGGDWDIGDTDWDTDW